MKRSVQPEWLDALSPDDPRAQHSRRDLRRVNAWMRHPAILASALEKQWPASAAKKITELGAGDGSFLLDVAQRMARDRPAVEVTLLDKQPQVTADTLARFSKLSWRAEAVVAEVFAWPAAAEQVVVANLFLHHFAEERLSALLELISRRTQLFLAVEPRRQVWPWFCSRLLWAIGCNEVTRHDAPVSVRAGFTHNELSVLWPDRQNWQLTEHAVGLFSHLFIARRLP